MDLLDVYTILQRQEITLEQAAKALNLPVKDLKFRMTRWGHRLPLLLATLDKIRKDKMTRDEAAETLGISERQVNKLMNTWQVRRPVAEHRIKTAQAELKWEIRKKFAIDYIAGSCSLEEAAESAGVSVRQIRRWVSELVGKHFGMVFMDLRRLADRKRRRLADEIEAAEGLELAKQQVLNEVARGDKDPRAVALERVLARRRRSNGSDV